jgi:hypothetical protein
MKRPASGQRKLAGAVTDLQIRQSVSPSRSVWHFPLGESIIARFSAAKVALPSANSGCAGGKFSSGAPFAILSAVIFSAEMFSAAVPSSGRRFGFDLGC